MSDPVPSTRSMPHIPLEVQLKIADQLETVECGRNVSLVCKSLRDVGEIKVWMMLDLTSGWDVDDGKPMTTAALRARAAIVDSKLRHTLAAIASYPIRGESIRWIRLEPSDGVGNARARSLLDFLRLVSTQLTHLSILPLTLDPGATPAEKAELGCAHFLSTLDEEPIPFPKVTDVQFVRGTKTLGPIPTFILRITTLRRLEFNIDEINLGATLDLDDNDGLLAMDNFTVNQVNSNRGRQSRAALGTLLELAPQLSVVTVTGGWDDSQNGIELAQGARFKRVNHMLVMRMNQHYSDEEDYEYDESEADEHVLETPPFAVVAQGEAGADAILNVKDEQDQGNAEQGGVGDKEDGSVVGGDEVKVAEPGDGEGPGFGFGDVEYLSDSDYGREEFRGWDQFMPPEDPYTADQGFGPGVSTMELQDAVMEVQLKDGAFDYDVRQIIDQADSQDLILPIDPSLHHLSILTVPRLPVIETISLPIDTTPSETGHLSSQFIRQLRRAPQLTEISLPYSDKPFPADFAPSNLQTYYHVRSHSWVADGHRGALISQYARGYSTEEIGFELWHVRVLESTGDGKRRWRDLTRFKGSTVPREILEGAYEKAGLKIDDAREGRCMSFGKGYKAWYYLHDWREKAGDRDDEEDRLSDASFE